MSTLPRALPRSESKAKLLKHLNMPEKIYILLTREADVVYKELVGDKRNLKPRQRNFDPPYDWNDLSERSREDAVNKLAAGGDSITRDFWQKGSVTLKYGLPWLPTWFLYKLFRHRDGRAKFSKSRSPAPAAYLVPDNGQYKIVTYSTTYDNEMSLAQVNGGISSAMQDPAYVTTESRFSTRDYYDPVREKYIKRA